HSDPQRQNVAHNSKESAKHPRTGTINVQHPAVNRQQSFGINEFRHWRRATDYCDPLHPLRHRNGRRVCVRCAAGYREHSKLADTEMADDSFYNTWPIAQLAIELQARAADA